MTNSKVCSSSTELIFDVKHIQENISKVPFLAQLIICAITSHPSVHDCCWRYCHCCHCWHCCCHQHCGQKLTSQLIAWILRLTSPHLTKLDLELHFELDLELNFELNLKLNFELDLELNILNLTLNSTLNSTLNLKLYQLCHKPYGFLVTTNSLKLTDVG